MSPSAVPIHASQSGREVQPLRRLSPAQTLKLLDRYDDPEP